MAEHTETLMTHPHKGNFLMAAEPGLWIDRETLNLVGPDRDRCFTAHEWDQQTWPPCLVCGAEIEVSGVPTQSLTEVEPTFLIGRWKCPQGCNPRDQRPAPDMG